MSAEDEIKLIVVASLEGPRQRNAADPPVRSELHWGQPEPTRPVFTTKSRCCVCAPPRL